MSDLLDFQAEVSKAAGIVDDTARKAASTVADIAQGDLKDSTPVDTGRMREGWRRQDAKEVHVAFVTNKVRHATPVNARDGVIDKALEKTEPKAQEALDRLLDPLAGV